MSILTREQAEHLQFCKDDDYLASVWEQMVEEHPDSHIAVYKEKVVATGELLADVLAELDDKGVPRRLAVIQFTSTEPLLVIL